MKRHELLEYFDGELLDKLFGFCYARTSDSYEAQELCSDIIFALVKAAHSEGEISSLYSFIWRVARNVYADFSADRRKRAEAFYEGDAFSCNVESVLKERYFKRIKEAERPFSVYGYVDNGRTYGGGWDGADARNICGYAMVQLENIYLTRIRKHFHCGWNVSNDPQLQLAIRAIDGVQVSSLSETEKEQAAKAIECGYLYREDDMLYTEILVNTVQDRGRLFDISRGLRNGYFEEEAALVAEKLAALIRKSVPDYLLGEWRYANDLANLPVIDSLVEALIEKGILIPPEDGIGAEGCWMAVEG